MQGGESIDVGGVDVGALVEQLDDLVLVAGKAGGEEDTAGAELDPAAVLVPGVGAARFVSDSSQRFSCSARFIIAELLRASSEDILADPSWPDERSAPSDNPATCCRARAL